MKTVSPEALARSYAALYPTEALPLTADTFSIFANWLTRYQATPDKALATVNWAGKVTKALFVALGIKQPRIKADMVAALSPVVPFRQTFRLLTPLVNVQCDNFVGHDEFTVPAGLLVRLEHPRSTTEIVVCVVDDKGEAPGIELTYVPTYHVHIASTHDRTPIKQTGYRFVVGLQALGAAIGIEIPMTVPDLVGDMIAHETGTLDRSGTRRLVRTLRKTGTNGLQGHYGRLVARS